MNVILDTCVLSELRTPGGNSAVKNAVSQIPDGDIYLSVLSLGEIVKGISLLQSSKRKNDLAIWLTGLKDNFSDRIIPVDLETTQLWGELTASLQRAGIILPAIDGLLAATAISRRLRLMTRNSRHFKATGAEIVDPWR